MKTNQKAILSVEGLQNLVEVLKGRGYRVVGPTVQDYAIVYDDIDSLADLPKGWTDEQDGGRYRLVGRDDDALFGGHRDADLALHPTVKPVALVADAILDCSKRRGIILGAFAGSGTTLIAAERTAEGRQRTLRPN